MRQDMVFYFLISFLILIDILIFGGTLFVFYKFDATILGSIIGFVGTIIGGFITMLGVRATIDAGNKQTYYNSLLSQYAATVQTIKKFANMTGCYWEQGNSDHYPYNEAVGSIRAALGGTNGIMDVAANATPNVFETIDEFDQYIEFEYGLMIEDSFEKRDSYAYHDTQNKINSCMEKLIEERKRLRKEIQENHPKQG